MSDVNSIVYVAVILVLIGLTIIVMAGMHVLRGRIPEDVRTKYPKRVLARSQMPFTERWMDSIDPKDIPVLVRARTRKSLFFMAGVIFIYLMLILRVMQLHMIIRMLTDRPH